MSNTTQGLLTRDGHASDLTLDRLALGGLQGAEQRAVEDHLQACEGCRARAEAIGRFDEDFQAEGLPDWLPVPQVVSLEARRREASMGSRWIVGGLLAAAAAVVLVIAIEPPRPPTVAEVPGDGIRIKGADFGVQVHLKEASGSRPVGSGDAVHPGESIGFEVMARKPGYLMIVGVDEKHEGYLCYPQGGNDRATLLEGSDKSVALGEAMRLDDVLGREHIIGLLCPEPFSFEEVRAGLERAARGAGSEKLETILTGCQQREVVLDKRARSQ